MGWASASPLFLVPGAEKGPNSASWFQKIETTSVLDAQALPAHSLSSPFAVISFRRPAHELHGLSSHSGAGPTGSDAARTLCRGSKKGQSISNSIQSYDHMSDAASVSYRTSNQHLGRQWWASILLELREHNILQDMPATWRSVHWSLGLNLLLVPDSNCTQELEERLASATGVDSRGATLKDVRPADALLLLSGGHPLRRLPFMGTLFFDTFDALRLATSMRQR